MGLSSDTQVRAAAPRDTEYFLRDGDGLYLRIRPTGKTWTYRYQVAGKAAKLGLRIPRCKPRQSPSKGTGDDRDAGRGS
jgi:hypothetical protein